jgi:hypothetical protein
MLRPSLCCGLLLAVGLPAVGLPAQADAGLKELCAAIAPAITGTVTEGKVLPLPKAEALARIAAVAPGKPTLDGAAVFSVEHAWPEDDAAEARLVRMPVGDDSGRRVVLIGGKDSKCRGGAVLDGKGKLATAWNAFADQFTGKTLARLDGAVTRAAAAKLIAAAEGGKDDKGKAIAALVDLRRQMLRQAAATAVILDALEGGNAPAAARIDEARAAYRAMQQRAADLAPTLGKASAEYAELTKSVLTHLDGLAAADDAAKRKAAHKSLKHDCRTCHELHSDKWQGDFEEFAVNERLRLGLGDRVFLVGYDVLADGVDGKDAQVLADAFYRAALVIDCSMQ